MSINYSVKICEKLAKDFQTAALHRPMQVDRYETGTELTYHVTGVNSPDQAKIRLKILKFVGGGFAGQVYQVKIIEIKSENGKINGLDPEKVYAIKILIPPTAFSRLFRNALYGIAFQAPFQLQVNPTASRSGAMWQKFIRRGAKIYFGDEKSVVDIYATFIDSNLGSCGEISEWVQGRTWQLEVDERLDILKRWRKSKKVDTKNLGSPEYRAKYRFMTKFVELLIDMGAYEFARQYEWTTCKSQPNCLKREDDSHTPTDTLTAVDFRAGLALLPFLPMSPGDIKLIAKGLKRGSLIQFDRGDVDKLERFIEKYPEQFADMLPMLEELKTAEQFYRNSIPDITHNHVRLFFSSQLWSTILTSAITGWKVRNLIDDKNEVKLRNNKFLTLFFLILGIIPILGGFLRRIWGQPYWRKHYLGLLTSFQYLKRGIRAKIAEKLIVWHRSGRIEKNRVEKLQKRIWPFLFHIPLSILPAGIHKFLTDLKYAKERLDYLLLRPFRLYLNADLREQWLRDMIAEGQQKRLLSSEDAEIILNQVDEPFIQKYLKSLAVHLCTLPVTQVVSIIVAIIYILMHPEMPRGQAYGIGLGIIALFQVVPISPGSLARGLYVLFLVIKEKNFKDYNIAVFLAFFKYIGYLSFPIQMAYRYPTLARFMAGHWATEAVHIVPVFGERGALLEHWVFSLFYNWPLTIRRRMNNRSLFRASLQPRYWHIILYGVAGSVIFGIGDFVYIRQFALLPNLGDIWWLVIIVPVLCGSLITLGAGGAPLVKRIISGAIGGITIGLLYTAFTGILSNGDLIEIQNIFTNGLWRIFIFTIFSITGVLLTEMKLPDPKIS